MLNKRFWMISAIGLISLVFVILFWLTLQQGISPEKSKEVMNNNQLGNLDEFIGMTIKIPGTEKDGYWELKVDKFESLADVGHLNNIEGSYFRSKKAIYRIFGKTGVIDWKNRILSVSGSVLLQTVDNTKRLTATEMVWDPNLKTITAQQKVILQTPNQTMTTEKFISNLDLTQLTFTGMTKVIYKRANHD